MRTIPAERHRRGILEVFVSECRTTPNRDGGWPAQETALRRCRCRATGKTTPATGIETKFSAYHAAAVALARGDGNEGEFSDEAVRDSTVLALRERVVTDVGGSIGRDESFVRIIMSDGTSREHHVAHAAGSIENPMPDRQLEQKFRRLSGFALSEAAMDRLTGLCWTLDQQAEAVALNEAAVGDI